ncbi:MAG TPA: hypothetical protein VIY27_13885 [Myxococcota bacterium]
MQSRVLRIAAGLIPLAWILLVAGAAWAPAIKTPIEGAWFGCRTLEGPDRAWTDEDGDRHSRNVKFLCRHTGDIVGREIGWESWDQNGGPGTVSGHGYTAFTRTVFREPTKAVVRYTFECTLIEGERICTEDDLLHLEDGSLIKLSAIHSFEPLRPYTGTLLDPPGRN